MALTLQQRLRNLCCNTRWCYAAFWKLQPSDNVVVTWEDGHCGYEKFLSDSSFALMQESEHGTAPSSQVGGNPLQQHINIDDATGFEVQVRLAVAKMSNDIYSLGKGLIGHAALTGKHQWLYAPEEADYSAKGTTDNGTNLEENPADFSDRSDIGIKTIAVVAVPHGVVELGSTQKMIEDINFVSHIQALFDSRHSASAAFPLDFLPKTEVLGSLQGKPQAVPMSEPMPLCKETFTTLNGPQKQDVLCNCPFNYGHCVNGPNFPMVGLSKKQASPSLHPSDFSIVDEAVSSPRKVPYNCSTEGNAISISMSTLSSMSGASCGPPSESLYGCKSLSKMDENFKNTLLSPSESVHPIWDCLCLGEVGTWHKNFSAESSRLKFPDDTIEITKSSRIQLEDSADNLKVFSGSNCSQGATKMIHDRAGCFLKGSCWHMEKSSPQFLIKYNLSKILAPVYMKGKERAVSRDSCALPTTPGERIEYVNSTEKIIGSSWSNEAASLQSFETMSNFYALHSNINAEALLGTTVADVAECFQLHPNMVNDSTSQDLASKSECVVSTQSTLSANSCSSNNFSNTASKQPKSKALQSACKDRESLKKCEIIKVVTENFGDADLRQSSKKSQFKLKDDTCIEEMEPPQAHHQATMKSRKRSRPTEDPRPQQKDRQLVKDRLRKLRKIVPNSTRCSIDELLERTIKHVHFLQSVTQHDKKRQHVSESKSSDPNLQNH